jgi:glutaredoxin
MITIYTTETCPKCKILKKKLADKNIDFIEIHNKDKLLELNITEVPVLKINDTLYDFTSANTWINNQ